MFNWLVRTKSKTGSLDITNMFGLRDELTNGYRVITIRLLVIAELQKFLTTP